MHVNFEPAPMNVSLDTAEWYFYNALLHINFEPTPMPEILDTAKLEYKPSPSISEMTHQQRNHFEDDSLDWLYPEAA